MAITIENLFFYAVFAFDLLIVIQFFLVYQKKIDKNILWLLLVYSCLNSTVNYLQSLLPNYEYLLLVFFTTIEFFIISSIFYIILSNKKIKRLIIISSFLFLIIVVLNFEFGKLQKIDSVPIAVETIMILIYCFYYLYEQMNIVENTLIYNRYHFWIVMGIMIYLGGSFFIYIFTNQAHPDILDDFWFLTYVFYIIKNIFFLIGINYYAKNFKRGIHPNLHPSLS